VSRVRTRKVLSGSAGFGGEAGAFRASVLDAPLWTLRTLSIWVCGSANLLVEMTLTRWRTALIATSLVATLFLLVANAAASRDAMLTVDGQSYHIETFGTSGSTIVFEAGLGNDSTTWRLVAGPTAEFARVVLYDRPGLGKSLPMMRKNSAVTADEVAANLHAVLAAADIRPPYILVGHSLGGLYVQMFAKKYPKGVSGVVLLDSSSPYAPSELKTRARLKPGTAAYLEEAGIPESNQQVIKGDPFPDVPLTVIAATDHGPYFKKWEPTLMRLQQQLTTLSPKATFIVAQGSGHDVQLDRPQIVIDAVRRMAGAAGVNR
jgi:pimeloyl-ACP methyl ester carboxylesterase